MTAMLDQRHLRRAFERAARHYDDFAVPHREICARALERLDYIRCQPGTVLDLGAGTGQAAFDLVRRYPRARVVAVDVALGMVREVKRRRHWRRRPQTLCAQAGQLPLADASVDLVFSAGTFHWCADYRALFAEIRRVLSPDGVLLFTTFGPDTLRELREAWARIDARPHVHDFVDMHQLGDGMLAAGLVDPVVDAEWLSIEYPSPLQLMRDLKGAGVGNVSSGRSVGLRARTQLEDLVNAYPLRPDEAGIAATYEVIYGHAWGNKDPVEAARVNVTFQRSPG